MDITLESVPSKNKLTLQTKISKLSKFKMKFNSVQNKKPNHK